MSKKTKILVVRFRRVGDAVLSTSLINSLKKTIPNSEIHYVLDDSMSELFVSHPNIDKVISFSKDEKKSIFKYLRKVRSIVKKEKYDVIIDMRSTVNSMMFSLFSFGTKYRIGMRKSYNVLICNHRVKMNGEDSYILQKLALLSPLSADYKLVTDELFDVVIPKDEIANMRTYMTDKGIDFDKPVLLCNVATRVVEKQWNIEYMKEVISKILDKYKDVQLIFNYANKEEQVVCSTLFRDLGSPKSIFMDIEARSLIQLGAMLANCDYLFGNEGGSRHIAQALSVPSFAIYSPGNNMETWLPNRSDKYDGICSDEQKEKKEGEHWANNEYITVADVWEILDKKLEKYLSGLE